MQFTLRYVTPDGDAVEAVVPPPVSGLKLGDFCSGDFSAPDLVGGPGYEEAKVDKPTQTA